MTGPESPEDRIRNIVSRIYLAHGAATALVYVADTDHPSDIEDWKMSMFGLSHLICAETGRLHADLDDCAGDPTTDRADAPQEIQEAARIGY